MVYGTLSGQRPNNRVGLFPGVAVGWKISGEEFFNIEIVSQLKLATSSYIGGRGVIFT